MTELRLYASALALERDRPSGARERIVRLLEGASAVHDVTVLSADVWTEEERSRLARCEWQCIGDVRPGALWRWRNERKLLAQMGAFSRGAVLLQDAMPWVQHARLIGTVHDLRHWRHGILGVVHRSIARRSLQRARLVACPSEAVRNELAMRVPECAARIRYVPNGVDSTPMATGPRAQVPRLLWVGHCEPRKDPQVMLKAFALLSVAWPSLHLDMVGKGALDLDDLARRVLARELRSRWKWHEDCDAMHLRQLRASATLGVVTSQLEGFSLVPLECLSAGLPVIVTDLAAHREVLGQAAGYVPVGDPAALAAAIDALLRDEQQRQHLALNGRVVAERLSWDSAVRQFLTVLTEVQTSA